MARLDINVGANANDGTGDDLRTAMQKINTNFAELYGTTAEANDLIEDISPQLGGNLDLAGHNIFTSITNSDINIVPNGTGSLIVDTITIHDNTIKTNASNANLELSANGSGTVVLNKLTIATGPIITAILDEDTMSSNSATALATQQSIKAYVAATVTNYQGVTFVGDDSTGTLVSTGETFQIVGTAGITTAVSGDTLTITGPTILDEDTMSSNSATALATQQSIKAYVDGIVGSMTFVGDDSTGVTLSSGETFKIAGATGITTAVSGDTLTITGPDLTSYITASSADALSNKTGNISQWTNDANYIASGGNVSTLTNDTNYISDITLNISADDSATITVSNNGGLVFSGGTGITTSTTSGGSVTISRDSISNILNVTADDSTTQAFNEGGTLIVTGGTGISTSLVGNTLTLALSTAGSGIVDVVGSLQVTDTNILGLETNADISITPNGTGDINLDAVVKVGSLNTNGTISSNGTGDLILTTNIDTPSVDYSSITLQDGTNGNVIIKNAEHGYTRIGNTDWSTINATRANWAKTGLVQTSSHIRNLGAYNLDRHYANAIGAQFQMIGSDPDNGNVTTYRAQSIELYSDLQAKQLISKSLVQAAASSKNLGHITTDSSGQLRTYAGGPIALGVANYFRNSSASSATVEETATISSYTDFFQPATSTVVVNNLHSVTSSFNLASQGGTTDIGNIKAFVATGNWLTNGATTVDNYHAFWAGAVSEATNNWGIYVESADWENYLGGLTIVDNTIRADRSNDNLYLTTGGTGKVIVSKTLSVDTVELNSISSADSSAIQINDGLNVSGVLSANNIDTNTISSVDSSAVTINDNLDVGGSLFVNTISSADSSAIQIVDAVNISGELTVAGNFVVSNFITNRISSNDSSSVIVNDNLDVSGTLLVHTINSADADPITVLSELNVGTIDVDTIKSVTNNVVNVTDSLNVSDNVVVGSMLTLSNKTVAQLNVITPATGSMSYCTNEGTGAQPVYYDGGNWRTIRTGSVISA
jgi:hypothetical protein